MVYRSCVPNFWEKTTPSSVPSFINISLVWPMGQLSHRFDLICLISYIFFLHTLIPSSSVSVWKRIIHHFIHPEHYLYAAYFISTINDERHHVKLLFSCSLTLPVSDIHANDNYGKWIILYDFFKHRQCPLWTSKLWFTKTCCLV